MIKKLIGLLVFSLLLVGCGSSSNGNAKKTITNTVEVETSPVDISHYEFLEGELADYVELPIYEVANIINNGGSALIYFGYETCDWCNRAIPELNKVLLDYDFTTYYVNAHSEKYTFTDADIDALYEAIKDTLNDGTLYVPHVIGIKNGEIVGYQTSLVDSYHPEDISNPNDQMSDAQKEELQKIYREIIEKTVD